MKLCGLTGGVGMGKSTAAGFLLQHGARVIDTDELARRLVHPGQPALEEIHAAFGPEVISPDGSLRREVLAHIVFADVSARQKLEGILHPRIRNAWLEQVEAWRKQECSLAVVVIPLLFETCAVNHFEKVLCVACSSISQQRRLVDRGWSKDEISRRIAAQWAIGEKISSSHHVIWTEGAKEVHEEQVRRIMSRL